MAMKPVARGFLGIGGNGVFEIAEHHIDLGTSSGTLARTFSICGGTKWIMRSSRNGNSRSGGGAPIASGLKKLRGSFIGDPKIRSIEQDMGRKRQAAFRMTRECAKAQG